MQYQLSQKCSDPFSNVVFLKSFITIKYYRSKENNYPISNITKLSNITLTFFFNVLCFVLFAYLLLQKKNSATETKLIPSEQHCLTSFLANFCKISVCSKKLCKCKKNVFFLLNSKQKRASTTLVSMFFWYIEAFAKKALGFFVVFRQKRKELFLLPTGNCNRLRKTFLPKKLRKENNKEI